MLESGIKGVIVNVIPATKFSDLPDQLDDNTHMVRITKSSSEHPSYGIKIFTIAIMPPRAISDGSSFSGKPGTYGVAPEDVAMLVLFCISILSDHATPKMIEVNGKKILISYKTVKRLKFDHPDFSRKRIYRCDGERRWT